MRVPFRSSCSALAVLSLAGVGALTGCGSSEEAAADGRRATGIAVRASDDACDVASTDLDAGTHEFTVTNAGSSTTEFYVYGEGDRVMAEVENVAPGVSRSLLVELPAGEFEAACKPGMVGDGIRTTLTVRGVAAQLSDSQALADAVDGYTDYVASQVATLQRTTRQFADAVTAGDVAGAKALYPLARTSFERVEPVAESFGDLDPQIDARENDVEEGAPWTGFHVLEKVLWTGGDVAAAAPVAAELVADVDELAGRAGELELQPLDLANGALGLLDEIAGTKITGEEDRYSHTDLYDIQANLEGSQAAIAALRPVVAERDAELATALDTQFQAMQTALQAYRDGQGWVDYSTVTEQQRRALSDQLNALAAPVSRVPEVIAG